MRLLTFEDQALWVDVLNHMPASQRTLYHHPGYVASWVDNASEQAVALYGCFGSLEILYPFIRKAVPAQCALHPAWDLISPYGHGGLLLSAEAPLEYDLKAVNAAINQWCKDHAIACEFIRLLPHTQNYRDVQTFQVRQNLLLHFNGKQDEWPLLIKSRARRDAKKAIRNGCVLGMDASPDAIRTFGASYHRFCKEKELSEGYHFADSYFERVGEMLSSNVLVLTVTQEQEMVATALVLFDERMVIYHLSCSTESGRRHLANDLLLYGIVEFAASRGATSIFWGGGLTNTPDDPLFRFKAKYANREYDVQIGTVIHSQSAYEYARESWSKRATARARDAYGNYFLCYHQPTGN